MKRYFSISLALIVFQVSLTSVAWAQYEPAWVDINLGANRVAESQYGTSVDMPVPLRTAVVGTEYVFPQGWAADVGGGYMFNSRLGLGGTVAGSRNRDFPVLAISIADASARTQAITPLDRFDIALHLHAMMDLMPESDRVRLRAFAGPSYFHGIHETVDAIAYSPVIPTSAVQITSFTFSESDGGGWGAHVGGDVSYFLAPNVGLGALVRYSRGSVELEDFSGRFKVKAGGLQYAGGLRLRF
jgi:hypothetical protein